MKATHAVYLFLLGASLLLAPVAQAGVFTITLTESAVSTEPDREWFGTFEIDDSLLTSNAFIPLDDFQRLRITVGTETYTLGDAGTPLTDGVLTDAAGLPTAFEDPGAGTNIDFFGSVFNLQLQEAPTSSWVEFQQGVGVTGRRGTYTFTPENLLPNNFFHVDTAGWSDENGAAFAWDPADVDASATSGSVLVTIGSPTAGITSPCVPVDLGTEYLLRAWHAVDPNEIRFESIGIQALWFSVADCSNASIGMGALPLSGNNSGIFVLSEGTITSPPTAMSARVTMLVAAGAGIGNTEARFDSVFLPEPGSALVALAVLSGIAVLSRQRAA